MASDYGIHVRGALTHSLDVPLLFILLFLARMFLQRAASVASDHGIHGDAGRRLCAAWRIVCVCSVQVSLQNYPHKVVELTGSAVMGTFLEWAEGNQIDILVIGAPTLRIMLLLHRSV